MKTTVQDCTLDGSVMDLDVLETLTPAEIARVVGPHQYLGDEPVRLEDHRWSFALVPLQDLRFSNEHGEEPKGGWKASYLRHQAWDEEAVAGGSHAYAGRQEWLAEWAADSRINPVILELHEGRYRIIDGHRRVAGAFWNECESVAAFVGEYLTRND